MTTEPFIPEPQIKGCGPNLSFAPPDPDYVAPAIDEKTPVPPCCAAMRSAVITAYRATWQDNLRLIEFILGGAGSLAQSGWKRPVRVATTAAIASNRATPSSVESHDFTSPSFVITWLMPPPEVDR